MHPKGDHPYKKFQLIRLTGSQKLTNTHTNNLYPVAVEYKSILENMILNFTQMIDQAEICFFRINIFQILSTSWSVFLMLITQRQQLLNGNLSIK